MGLATRAQLFALKAILPLLIILTSELLSKERKPFIYIPTLKGKQRTSTTVNRYITALSSSLTYVCRPHIHQFKKINSTIK